MSRKRLSASLAKDSNFVVVGELAAGPKFNFAPIEKFLTGAKEAGPDAILRSGRLQPISPRHLL